MAVVGPYWGCSGAALEITGVAVGLLRDPLGLQWGCLVAQGGPRRAKVSLSQATEGKFCHQRDLDLLRMDFAPEAIVGMGSCL